MLPEMALLSVIEKEKKREKMPLSAEQFSSPQYGVQAGNDVKVEMEKKTSNERFIHANTNQIPPFVRAVQFNIQSKWI